MSDLCFKMLEDNMAIEQIKVCDKGEVLYTFKLRNKQVPFKIVR